MPRKKDNPYSSEHCIVPRALVMQRRQCRDRSRQDDGLVKVQIANSRQVPCHTSYHSNTVVHVARRLSVAGTTDGRRQRAQCITENIRNLKFGLSVTGCWLEPGSLQHNPLTHQTKEPATRQQVARGVQQEELRIATLAHDAVSSVSDLVSGTAARLQHHRPIS